MELPPGTVDPLFLHELALELKMTVGELTHGRGTPMSAHELCVSWPLFFDWRHKQAEREQERHQRTRSRGRRA